VEEQIKQDILAMLEFLKRLSIMRQKAINDVAKQPGIVWLHDLDQYPEFTKLFSRTDDDGTEQDGQLLLRIVKPDLEPCPMPPEMLLPWLKPGWKNYKKDAAHLIERLYPEENINVGDSEVPSVEIRESFEEDPERIASYADWTSRRAVWTERQKILSIVQNLFSDLYDMYNMIRQQPESYELMVGNGILTDSMDKTINHPVFLKRINIELKAEENTILISDTEALPELYILMLDSLSDVHNDIVKKVEDDAREQDIR